MEGENAFYGLFSVFKPHMLPTLVTLSIENVKVGQISAKGFCCARQSTIRARFLQSLKTIYLTNYVLRNQFENVLERKYFPIINDALGNLANWDTTSYDEITTNFGITQNQS